MSLELVHCFKKFVFMEQLVAMDKIAVTVLIIIVTVHDGYKYM